MFCGTVIHCPLNCCSSFIGVILLLFVLLFVLLFRYTFLIFHILLLLFVVHVSGTRSFLKVPGFPQSSLIFRLNELFTTLTPLPLPIASSTPFSFSIQNDSQIQKQDSIFSKFLNSSHFTNCSSLKMKFLLVRLTLYLLPKFLSSYDAVRFIVDDVIKSNWTYSNYYHFWFFLRLFKISIRPPFQAS